MRTFATVGLIPSRLPSDTHVAVVAPPCGVPGVRLGGSLLGASLSFGMQLGMTILCVGAIALSGCKKDEAGGGGHAGGDVQTLLKAVQDKDVPAINGLVPAAGPKVTFEARVVDDKRVAAAVPAGWKTGVIPDSFQPPDDAGLGFQTRFSVGSNCDGSCTAKDWKATAEKVDFAQLRNAETFVIEQEEDLTGPAGKLLVAATKDGKSAYVSLARWKEGAGRYLTCHVTLDEAALSLKPVFVAACRAAQASFLQ